MSERKSGDEAQGWDAAWATRRRPSSRACALARALVLVVAVLSSVGDARAAGRDGARDRAPAASVGATVLPARSLPGPEPVGLTVADVPPHVFPRRRPPEGAPNVVVVLLDDVGFGASSTFGGPVETPHLDALARGGLRYNRFHTTAICSPTRASLLTGRNSHAVGVGAVLNTAQPWPGRAGIIGPETATIAEILRQHGYATAAFGKWHLTPDHEASPNGPFDRWPTSMGFEHFYGFLGGETHQFQPTLFEGTRPVVAPRGADYHVTADLADRAIEWVGMQRSLDPDRRFFLYLAPGATHAPLHAPREWIDRYAGRFDAGWDALRETIFARQKALGVVPKDAVLTPRADEMRAWESLDDEERRVATRLMEVYAGFLAHTDEQIGRVFDALREMEVFDDTLVLYVVGDNGGSGEGGADYGTWNEMGRIQGVVQTPAELLERLDDLGGPSSYPHYSAGWAWATNTPFPWVKQVASHLGGTRNPLVVSWPSGMRSRGGLRSQFGHVNDVAPTILEAVGVPAPVEVNGVGQKPMDGTSLVYSFDDAKAPERHATQYFEILGNRALYHHGFLASSRNRTRVPWGELTSEAAGTGREVWELYDLRSDFSQGRDLAATEPDRLRDLQLLFYAEAGRNQVLPISGRPAGESPVPALGAGRHEAVYHAGAVGLHESAVPDLKNVDHRIVADVVVPDRGARGVVATQGGVVAGWALYVTDDGRPAYVYNLFGKTWTTIEGEAPLAPGPAHIELRFDYEGPGWGRGADLRLRVDGKEVARGNLERSVPVFFSIDETFDVGVDTGSPAGHYPPGFPFEGRIERVVLRASP
ncbi:MAG: arylsulfatase [Spirochaetaceae bacterium]|nr:arylsulfatase [Spirochaetaceae bacterium]